MKRQLAAREKLTSSQREIAFLTAVGSMSGGAALWLLGNRLGWRELSGVPFILNPSEHIGNVWPSLPAAFTAAIVAATFEKYVDATAVTRARRIVAAGALGLAFGAGLNATTETTPGYNYVGRHLPFIEDKLSVPLGSDLAWGTVSTVLVATGFAAWRDRKITGNASVVGPSTLASIVSTEPMSGDTLAEMRVL